MRRTLILAVALISLAGCATVISDQSLRLVDRGVSFAELRQDPQRHIGRYLLLGGVIVSVRNTSEGGELEVAQLKTDERGEITDTGSSGGRFIAASSTFIDPALYKPGNLVTLVGEVRAKRTKPLGDLEYTYPVLAIREIHLWRPGEVSLPPTFHFGIGVGTIIR
jgi:outer membrane lipoprotein